jgi:carboxyl-terminal processing protease
MDYGDIGYIRINSFAEDTTNSVIKEISALKARHGKALRGLILDLRNNPGGLLDQAINVSDIFLDSGEIVSTKGRLPESNTSFKATKQGTDILDLPIVVLINGGSASASEIVAGALQDHKRAVIMGTKSFGKGSVQNVIPLPNKGAMRLTTARYYTPSGRSIQAEGIKPDIAVELAKIEFLDKKGNSSIYSESALKGHLTNDEAKKVGAATNAIDKVKEKLNVKTGGNAVVKDNEKELYEKDYQLARALDLLRGMLVFKNEQKPTK